jgi:hypothetical protein
MYVSTFVKGKTTRGLQGEYENARLDKNLHQFFISFQSFSVCF